MRLTYLAVGDPLLGQVWQYKTLDGVEAIEQKVSDSFFLMSKLCVTDVVDTIYLGTDAAGQLTLPNTGVNGDVWPMIRRMECYRRGLIDYPGRDLLLEIELPTVVTDVNWRRYAALVVELIARFTWVKRWQLMTMPEAIDSAGMLRCSSVNYVRMLRQVYTEVHERWAGIEVGGPGILQGITEYTDSAYTDDEGEVWHRGWLAEATGEQYGVDDAFDDVGRLGLLDCVDFFAFQGRQNFQELNFNVYKQVVTNMRAGLIAQGQRAGINLDIPFLSTYQGHYADRTSFVDMQLQGYRDLREYANAWAVNVTPFKTQLVDEFFDEENPDAVKNVYGLLYYYLGNDRKPAWAQFQFVLGTLTDFTKLPPPTLNVKVKRPHEENDNILYMMFMTPDDAQLATLLFPKVERDVLSKNPAVQRVALKAGLNRRYYLPDGTSGLLTTPVDITLRTYDFIIVIEQLDDGVEITKDLRDEVSARLAFYQRYATELLSMLPSTYPHESFDTNIYKLLRTVAIELGDGAYEKSILKDNYYLATAHGDALYNNFGVLVGLEWQVRWSEDDYRRILGGIIEALLHGAGKESVQRAVSLFTNLDVHVYEMFTDYAHEGLSREQSFDHQYRFTIEIEKPLGDSTNIDTLVEDVKLAANITRPAHTVPVVIIVLVGEESYKDWYADRYGRPFSQGDQLELMPLAKLSGNQYGWRAQGYGAIQRTADPADVDNSRLNGVLPLGPKYTLYDHRHEETEVQLAEEFPRPVDDMLVERSVEYAEEFPRPTNDEWAWTVDVDLHEVPFGWRVRRHLKSNGGFIHDGPLGPIIGTEGTSVLNFRTGFAYMLRDDVSVAVERFLEDVYRDVEDTLDVLAFLDMGTEEFPAPAEDLSMEAHVELGELRFGHVPSTALMTVAWPTVGTNLAFRVVNRLTNIHRAGVRYRLADDVTAAGAVELAEEFRRPAAHLSMRLYTVAPDGSETTLAALEEDD